MAGVSVGGVPEELFMDAIDDDLKCPVRGTPVPRPSHPAHASPASRPPPSRPTPSPNPTRAF